VCDYRRGFGLVNGYIDHLYTRLGTTSNYNATAKLHNSQMTTAPFKSFPACCIFTSRFLVTASNSGNSSASRAQVLSERRLPSNCLSFPRKFPYRTNSVASVVFLITLCTDRVENTVSNSTAIIACLSVAAGKFYRVVT
jgi:hypothetical protein